MPLHILAGLPSQDALYAEYKRRLLQKAGKSTAFNENHREDEKSGQMSEETKEIVKELVWEVKRDMLDAAMAKRVQQMRDEKAKQEESYKSNQDGLSLLLAAVEYIEERHKRDREGLGLILAAVACDIEKLGLQGELELFVED